MQRKQKHEHSKFQNNTRMSKDGTCTTMTIYKKNLDNKLFKSNLKYFENYYNKL